MSSARPYLAVVALIVALAGQHLIAHRAGLLVGACLLAAGAALFALATWRIRPGCAELTWDDLRPVQPIGLRPHVELLAPPCLLAIGALVVFHRGLPATWGWLVWGVAVLLLCWTGWRLGGAPRPTLWPRRELLAVAALTALGAAFRLYRLDELPAGLWWDEAIGGLEAVRILERPDYRPIYSGGLINSPYLWFYLESAFVAWLGRTPEALRSAGLIGGILYVPVMYALGRQLFGPRVALPAAAIAAVLLWNVNFSRNGWSYAWTLALDALAVALLTRALQRGGRGAALAGGIAWGIALHGYTPARLILPVALGLVGLAWLRRRRDLMRRSLLAVALFALGAVLAAAPLLYFVATNPGEYFSRPGQVFVLNEVRQQGRLDPLVDSVRKHALMFNVAGDRNGRHNLPNAPMLDQITAALFILGLGAAAARLARPSWGILPIWCLVGLAGGALTLSWEAPQALRGIEAQTPAILLAAAALGTLVAAVSSGRGESSSVLSTAVPVAVIVAIVGLNYHAYFVRKANDFGAWSAYSTAEAIASQQAAPLAATHAVYFDDTWQDHPTVRFLAPGLRDLKRLDPVRNLPLRDDRPVAVFLRGELGTVIRDLALLYRDAEVFERSPPSGGSPVLRWITVPADAIHAARGVNVRYSLPAREAPEVRTAPGLDLELGSDPSFPPPFAVEVTSVVAVEAFGAYRFELEGPPGAVLEINGVRAAETGSPGELTLPRGNNRLRIAASIDRPTRIAVRWVPPGGSADRPLPPGPLFRAEGADSGLLARYRRGSDWDGPVAFAQVDRHLQRGVHIVPLPRPYTVEWVGNLRVLRSGVHRFQTDAVGRAWLWIDDRPLVSDTRGRSGEASVQLESGVHSIRARFLDDDQFSRFDLLWVPPGGSTESVPTAMLVPPDGAFEQTGAAPPPPASAALPAIGEVQVRWLQSTRGEARGVAVAPDGTVFAVASTERQVLQLDAAGRPMGTWTHDLLLEPVDVATASDGAAWVLDAERGWLIRFDRAGTATTQIGGDALRTYRPRGLGIGPDDALYVADTGGNVVIKLAPDGAELGRYGPETGGPVQIKQPTDVAIDPSGDIYVLSGEQNVLIRLDPSGRYRTHWPIPAADTVRGPHLAIGPDGSLFITEPSQGRVARYTLDGQPAGFLENTRQGKILRRPIGIAVAPDGSVLVADGGLPGVVWVEVGGY